VGANVADGENAGVVQGATGTGLLLEVAGMLAIGDLLGEDLDRDIAAQAVTGAVDLAARPEPPHDLVGAESGADSSAIDTPPGAQQLVR